MLVAAGGVAMIEALEVSLVAVKGEVGRLLHAHRHANRRDDDAATARTLGQRAASLREVIAATGHAPRPLFFSLSPRALFSWLGLDPARADRPHESARGTFLETLNARADWKP
jgi:hypothetical protein